MIEQFKILIFGFWISNLHFPKKCESRFESEFPYLPIVSSKRWQRFSQTNVLMELSMKDFLCSNEAEIYMMWHIDGILKEKLLWKVSKKKNVCLRMLNNGLPRGAVLFISLVNCFSLTKIFSTLLSIDKWRALFPIKIEIYKHITMKNWNHKFTCKNIPLIL